MDRKTTDGGKRFVSGKPDSESLVKVLISTDNHLGYLERDPVRGEDSFRAFEEVLQLAKSNTVDMVLLAGDLFHDNKPSRRTIVRTMQILRRMCFGYEDVRLAVRSDLSEVNYMDECYAVSLPIFVIHGNHDDPTGAAGLDALSALDILSEANLITYFGKIETAKKIEVSPILLQKGATKIALYGLGNIRDELLFDTWSRQRRVKWLCPKEDPSSEEAEESGAEASDGSADEPEYSARARKEKLNKWFNIFALHQNRMTRGTSRGIAETLLPPWLDYVVWGHEHDSIPDLKLSKPPIVQPGSTVATSLSAGEAKPKHAFLLEVYKGALKHRAIPLLTTRNFEFDDIILSEQEGLSQLDPDGVKKFLDKKVTAMIERQETLFDKKLSSITDGSFKRERYGIVYPSMDYYKNALSRVVRQPLIRLRVEISGGWETLNAQRFGQTYVGRCACATDILHFFRQRKRLLKPERPFLEGQVHADKDENEDDYGEDLRSQMDGGSSTSDQNDKGCEIPRLVQYYLYHRKAGGSGLKFLELDKLSAAVDEFVIKSEARAIPEHVLDFLKIRQKETLEEKERTGKVLDETEILERYKNQATAAANRVLLSEKEVETGGKAEPDGSQSEKKMGIDEIGKDTYMVTEQSVLPEVEENLNSIHELLSRDPKIAAANKAAAAAAAQNEDNAVQSDEGSEDELRPGKPTRGRGRGRGRGSGTSRGSTSTARKPPRKPPVSSARSSWAIDDEEEEDVVVSDDDDDIKHVDKETPPPPPTRERPKRRAAAAQSAARTQSISIELDDDDDAVPVLSSSRKRKANTPATGSASRASARSRRETTPTATFSTRSTRTAFGSRARARRNTPTIDLEEEGGDDDM